MVPAIIITSAWRGVALATSNPNLDQSYFAEAVDIISIAQQLVPKTNGHNELARAQLTTSSSLVTNIPPPAVGWTSPGNSDDDMLLSSLTRWCLHPFQRSLFMCI